ncbi:uncharacterized protein BXIN_0549 [Babesia sp. Xinjiang]|uniref:uncharacterized protein n=1 Tax=Babesia sp. Xinjiang TaxID=462227 RepID=UPI000A23C4DE|nr:uncharacterized protein BXIN_0549 [Babesia sp. Xinjiang]ORM41949.1 hypothetical protein BXIN_0549 [Babesia sp. Xinjiang]
MTMKIFKSYRNCPVLRDRIVVSTGPFGYSIAATCLGFATLATILYGCIWAVEGAVLDEEFGFEMPLAIKLTSLISTLFLFSVLFKSVNMAYMLSASFYSYTLLHTMLLAGVMDYHDTSVEDTKELYRLLFYEPSTVSYYIFLTLSIVRLVVTFPLAYYVLILATIRVNGGTGWECKPALELEKENMDTNLDELKKRKDWVNTVVSKKMREVAFESPR